MILVTDILRWEEGCSLKPYIDTLGYPTIGVGKRIGPKGASLDKYQFEITQEMADLWLNEEINSVKMCDEDWVHGFLNGGHRFDAVVILISMEYQLGYSGLSRFKKMIAALKARDYAEAKKQALDSQWAKQTPERAMRHARVLGGEPLESVYAKYM